MTNLLVRGVEDALVQRLREQAAAKGHSAEAEHRAILVAALRGPPKRSFAQFLRTMPNVGRDDDFTRPQSSGEPRRVLD
jgi:plasmid stability protein